MTSPRPRWVLFAVAAAVLAFWLAEGRGLPLSVVDDGEYFWRADRLGAALSHGDFRGAAACVFERVHPFDVPLGRCRPFLWTYISCACWICGSWPGFFHVFSPLAFAAGVLLTGRVAHALTKSLTAAVLAQCLVALQPSALEDWLRAGLHEPVLLLTGGGALALALAPDPPGGGRPRLRTAAAVLLIVLFFFTKETSVHAAPTLVAAWMLFGRGALDPSRTKRLRATVGAGLAAAAALLVAYLTIVGKPAAGSYSAGYSLKAETIGSNAASIAGWLWSDFLWLGPLVVASAAWRIFRARAAWTFLDRVRVLLLVECCAYVAVYLPWSALVARVFVGFAFPFSLLAAIEIAGWSQTARESAIGAARGAKAALAATALAAAVFAVDWPTTLHRGARWLHARYEADAEMVATIARIAPRDGRVLFDVGRGGKELAYGTGLHLGLWHDRADVRIAVEGVDGADVPANVVADYQDRTSAPGLAAHAAAAEPTVISRRREMSAWSVRNVLRSAFFLLRRGEWPGVPLAAKTYTWRIWRGRR